MSLQLVVIDNRGGVTLASGTQGVIIGPLNLIGYRSKGFTIHNQGAVTLSGVAVQINPEPGTPSATDPRWETVATAQIIAAGGVKTIQSTDIAHWWRVVGLNNQTPSIVASGYAYASAL